MVRQTRKMVPTQCRWCGYIRGAQNQAGEISCAMCGEYITVDSRNRIRR